MSFNSTAHRYTLKNIKGESFKLQMTTCISANVIQGTIELIYDGWFYFRHNLF